MKTQSRTGLEPQAGSVDNQTIHKEILVEYLKLLHSEMHLRIEKNYSLVSLKLMSLAAVTSFAIINSEKVRGVEWLAYLLVPLIGIMCDLHIGYNLKWMNTTGTFIRDKVEGFFERQYGITLYETQALSFNAYLMRLVDALSTGFVVALGAVGFYQQSPFSVVGKIATIAALVMLYMVLQPLCFSIQSGDTSSLPWMLLVTKLTTPNVRFKRDGQNAARRLN